MNACCRGPDAEERLRELCRFVKAHEHIADSHNVDFFTSDSWSSLPAHWQRQLLALPDSTLCQLPLASDAVLSSTSGDLRQFLKSSRNLRLPAEPHWYSQNGPSDPLQYLQSEQSDPLQHPQNEPSDPLQYPQSGPVPKPLKEVDALDRFGMTAKKSHEVKRMADVVHCLARSRGAQQVLDLGSGRGYLSQYLAMRYNLSVVGVDAEGSNTHSAVERNRKAMRALKNVWSGQKGYITNTFPLIGERSTKQTISEALLENIHAESSSMKTEAKDTEQATFPTSTQPPADAMVTAAVVRLEEVQHQHPCSPLPCQSSTQAEQGCDQHGHVPSQDNHGGLVQDPPFAGNKLLDPFQNRHDKDEHAKDARCLLQCSNTGDEHSFVPTVTVVSNSHPNSHFVSPQSLSNFAYYTPVTGFLSLKDEPDAVIQLAEQQSRGAFQRDRPTIIVGLHTCGDLAATCLKFFLKARQLTALCIVGCCYHHIKEEGEGSGFPLSKFLLSLNFQLGRTMRMLALQSPERLSESEEGLGVESMFYRAVLQVILVKECRIQGDSRDYNIGKIYAKSKDFVDYVRKSLRKLELALPKGLTDERIQEYWKEYQPHRRSLFAFHQMRATVAPCIEAVIVLDRLLFLRESPQLLYWTSTPTVELDPFCCICVTRSTQWLGESPYFWRHKHDQGLVQHAECLSLFDPKVSPRTFAIVAEK